MHRGIQLAELEETRALVRAALPLAADERVRKALEASLGQFDNLLDDSRPEPSAKYSGSILYTLDEVDSPYPQQLELRVYYHWIDYDPLDEPHPMWGPTIAAIDVVAVHYFDDEGNEIAPHAYDLKVAWDRVQVEYERVEEACKRAGVIDGVGVAPSWYNPGRSAAPKMRVVTHMAPSASTRPESQQRHQHG